jgi:hypothetical protein
MYTSSLEESWLLNYENSTLNQGLLISNIAEDVCGGGTCAEFAPLLAGQRERERDRDRDRDRDRQTGRQADRQTDRARCVSCCSVAMN